MVTIDEIDFNANWLSLNQTADILNGENSGRLQGTLKMYLEYKGTFFNYDGVLRRTKECSDDDWDELYFRLANPENKHSATLPLDTNRTITQDIYVSQVKRAIKRIEETNKFENVLNVTFVAVSPSWLPGGNIKGVN